LTQFDVAKIAYFYEIEQYYYDKNQYFSAKEAFFVSKINKIYGF